MCRRAPFGGTDGTGRWALRPYPVPAVDRSNGGHVRWTGRSRTDATHGSTDAEHLPLLRRLHGHGHRPDRGGAMMAAAEDPQPLPEGFVHLVASLPLHSDPERVATLLGDGEPWRTRLVERSEPSGLSRFAIDLRLRVGGEAMALTTFGKAAFLDLGKPRRTSSGWKIEIGWRASTAAPLFPGPCSRRPTIGSSGGGALPGRRAPAVRAAPARGSGHRAVGWVTAARRHPDRVHQDVRRTVRRPAPAGRARCGRVDPVGQIREEV